MTLLGYVVVTFAAAGHELSHRDVVHTGDSCAELAAPESQSADAALVSTSACALCAHGFQSHTLPDVVSLELPAEHPDDRPGTPLETPLSRTERPDSSRAPPASA